jgi:hypothetical protein
LLIFLFAQFPSACKTKPDNNIKTPVLKSQLLPCCMHPHNLKSQPKSDVGLVGILFHLDLLFDLTFLQLFLQLQAKILTPRITQYSSQLLHYQLRHLKYLQHFEDVKKSIIGI